MADNQIAKDTVLNLQRLYAVVVGLAISEATKRLFGIGMDKIFTMHGKYLPEFVSFIATVVPFFHGMNRHLEELHGKKRNDRHPRIFLVVDFYFFFAMSLIILALGTLVDQDMAFFRVLTVLIIVDLVWAVISKLFTNSATLVEWIRLDIAALIPLTLLVVTPHFFPTWQLVNPNTAKWTLMALAIVRTAVDYRWNGDFYFGESPSPPA